MRKLKQYLLMAVLLALLPTVAFAGDARYEFQNKDNFKVTYDATTYTFSFELMVAGNAGRNGYLADGAPNVDGQRVNVVQISHDGNSWVDLIHIYGENYSQRDASAKQDTYVRLLNTSYGTLTKTSFTGEPYDQDFTNAHSGDLCGGEWYTQMTDHCNYAVKSIFSFQVDAAKFDENKHIHLRVILDPEDRDGDHPAGKDRKLSNLYIHEIYNGVIETHLVSPTLIAPYADLSVESKNAGQLAFVYSLGQTPTTAKLHVDGVEVYDIISKNGDATDGTFYVQSPGSKTTAWLECTFKVAGSSEISRNTAGSKVSVFPYLSIGNVTAEEYSNHADSIPLTPLERFGGNKLTWTMSNPDEDTYSSDQLMILRGYKSDYSDLESIGSVSLTGYDKIENGTAYYTYVDEASNETAFNEDDTQSTDPHKVYYAVARATAYSTWDLAATNYVKEVAITRTNTLPNVTKVTVTKEDSLSYKTNHRVKIRVEMASDASSKYIWNSDANIIVHRTNANSIYGGAASEKGKEDITISGSAVKWDSTNGVYYAETTDVIDCELNYFTFSAEVQNNTKYLASNANPVNLQTTSDTKRLYYSLAADLKELYATTDEYDQITVSWPAPSGLFTTGKLERADVTNGDNDNWTELQNFNVSTGSYEDKDIKIHHKYKYKATLSYTSQGQTAISTTANPPVGHSMETGKITGRIATANGMGLSGVKVQISKKGNDAAKLEPIYTDENGSFSKDGLVIDGDFTTYTISPTSDGGVTYVYAENGVINSFDAQLGQGKTYYSDVDFRPATDTRINGRVLFDGTTVPVEHANFKLNGHYLYKNATELVETDGKGDFAFTLPTGMHIDSLQVVKKGHTFKSNGKIKKGNDTEFSLTSSIESITLHDMTKTRLAGRIAGGYVQQAKPLGFGLSTNNIGDSICVIMQLEGDNTAYLVYNDDDVDQATRIDTCLNYTKQDTTYINVERHRMVIHANAATGEFFADLLPVKYKITAITANGYGSLFNKGMVAPVIDMTDSLTTHTYTYKDESKTPAVEYTTAYNAAYNYAFHSGINVTYNQMLSAKYGDMSYLGEEKVIYADVDGRQTTLRLAEPDTLGVYHYNLGHPLFIANKTYHIKGRAHEDYYYNNDKKTGKLDQVPVTQGTMVIDNGLTAKNTQTKLSLDSNGSCVTTFVADNQLFTQTGEKALGQFNMSLDIEGNYYDADELKAFVTGTRNQTTGVTTCVVDTAANIQLLDILRDPPGSKSFSTIAAGTTWNMNYKMDVKADISMTLSYSQKTGASTFVGTVAAPSGTGTVNGSTFSSTSNTLVDIPIPIYSGSWSQNYTLNLTTNETISTSSEATDCGAMSDIFIGATQNMQYSTQDVISVVDSTAYARLLPAISSKDVTLIQQGTSKDGTKFYLVRAEQFTTSASYPVMFKYTARHIYNHILPNLVKMRSELVKKMSQAEAQALADATNQPVYYTDRDDWDLQYNLASDTANANSATRYYDIANPSKGTKIQYDMVQAYSRQIMQWIKILLKNESEKVDAFKNLQSYKTTQSISSGTTYTYTQTESDADASKDAPYWATSGTSVASKVVATASKVGTSALKALSNYLVKQHYNKDKSQEEVDHPAETLLNKLKDTISKNAKDGQDKTTGTDVVTPGGKITFSIVPNIDVSYTTSNTKAVTNNRTRSYTLGVADDSYMDIEVYKARVDTTITGYDDMKTAFEKTYGSSTDNNVFLNNYIFREVGGATRNPWQDADSTIWYLNPNNLQPYPIAERTLKIDNPVLTINEPEINNVLPDQAAYFTIRMSNESELGAGIKLTKGSPLTLSVVQGSNPNGAQISIDGTPLGTGMTFSIAPNTQLTKTMSVLRGTGFDYDDLQLKLASADGTTSSIVNFSIHYVPSSSPVAIASPGDKWVLNTLNAKDENGYYMPITVNGFDVNYAGFDHIEMQYKKHTEGETGWTNLCSYYANDSLYQQANGTKEMIKTGTISNFRFYGEKDPVEMQYDIRAVAYSRNGTNFVTNSSPIITGMKDTRPPEVYGKVQPASGILTFTNEIEVPFTEDIAYNYLDETNNFTIEGYTNNTEINQGRTLYFPGTSDQCAKTLVDRNLSDRSFTIDLMVQPDELGKKMVFFSHKVNNKSKIKFGITADQHLFATIGDQTVTSDSVVKYANEQLHSVGVVCEKVETKMKVSFFYGNEILTAANGTLSTVYEGVGPVYLGTDAVNPEDAPFHGKMLNARLWSKALDQSSIAQFEGKLLNGYQTMLKDYWPLTNSKGNTATDEVSGADLSLTATSWVTATKYSLKLDNEVINMESAVMQASTTQDYSLGFWFRTADNYTPDDSKLVNIFGIGLDDEPVKGTGGMRIGFYKGNFIFRTGGKDYTLATTSAVADHSWHYYLMTVSPQMATACIYLDNELITKPNTEDLDGLGSSGARFGGEGFSGNIDMFSHWYMALSKSFQADINDRMLSGQEQSLNVYLPFTQQVKNDQGLYGAEFSPYNEKVVLTTASDGSTKTKAKTLMLKEYKESNTDKQIFAPMAASHVFKKIPFKWTSTNTSLMINLNIPDKEIDKQNIHFTLRDVEDLNGNPMASPISWSLYPDLTRLRWDKRFLTHSKSYGASDTMELEWNNTSGYSINYSITTTSSRISLSETDGIADPESNHKLKLTLSDQMPLGTYDEFVYINDLDNGLTEVLRISFTVSATEPEWVVTTDESYNETMCVDACVRQKDAKGTWYIDSNEKDIVAAFDGDVCVGKTYITPNTAIDNSNLFLTVKGKTTLDGSGNVVNMPITFMLWDSQSNTTYTLAAYDEYPHTMTTNFENNGLLGIPDPLDMRTTNLKYQYIDLKQGWNWVSFNIIPENVEKGPNYFLDRTTGLSDGDIFALTGANEFYTYNEKYKMWEGNVDAGMYDNNNVYQIYAHKDLTLTVGGVEFTDDNRIVTINIPKANDWSHLAYLLDAKQAINTALSDFAIGDKCPIGSVIKNYSSFAVAKANSRWVGQLQYMIPGEGYFLRSTQPVSDKIRYTNTTVYSAKGTHSFATDTDVDSDSGSDSGSDMFGYANMTNRESNSNMPVIATFADGDAQEGDVLVAYANGEVAGAAEYDVEEKLFFLSVNAQAGSFIRFAKVRNGAVVGVTSKTLDYQPDIVVGSLDAPYLVEFTATGIGHISNDPNANHEIYDVAGRKYNEYKDAKNRQNVYIIDGKKIAR